MGGGLKREDLFHSGTFAQIVSLDNLFLAWKNYRRGKGSKKDIQSFEFQLEDNIFELHSDLIRGCYRQGGYQQFRITDPKARVISKAPVRDRLLHQAIYQVLYPAFDSIFIDDSFSCRNNKGTHRAFRQLVRYTRQVSHNYRQPCWALKLDVKKFFDSVDHGILIKLLAERIHDPKTSYVLYDIIRSFEFSPGKGMPLGNLTSQLFANIYLDPLDQFVKKQLKAKYYLRYADDFLVLANDPDELMGYFVEINRFVKSQLQLTLHPNKVSLRKLPWGIDFVGYVALPYYQRPRLKTIKRILKKVADSGEEQSTKSLPPYLGYLGHASSFRLVRKLKQIIIR
mgnify:FL=1